MQLMAKLNAKPQVEIIGAEHVHERFLSVIETAFAMRSCYGEHDEPRYDIRRIVFNTDDEPEGYLSKFYPSSKSIDFNLVGIFKHSIMLAQQVGSHLTIHTIVWDQMLGALFHELHHGWAWAIDGDDIWTDGSRLEAEELAAIEWEGDMKLELVRQFQVEPPSISDWPFFSKLWEEEVSHCLDSSLLLDRMWVTDQINVMERQLVYYNPNTQARAATYREWVRATAKAMEDPRWMGKPVPLSAIRRAAPAPPSANKKQPNPAPPPPKRKPAAPPAPPKKKVAAARPAPVASTPSDEMEEARRSGKIGDDMFSGDWFDDDPQVFGHAPLDEGQLPAVDQFLEYRDAQAAAPRNRPTKAAFKRVCETVYNRIYAHIFDKCGWGLNEKLDKYTFSNPGAVKEGIYIGDIPNVRDVVVEMDALDDDDHWHPRQQVDGIIRGAITKNEKLPIYKLRLRTHRDTIVRRAVIAQDPTKKTWCGRDANNGHKIVWVTNDPVKAKKRWIRFCWNDRWTVCNRNR